MLDDYWLGATEGGVQYSDKAALDPFAAEPGVILQCPRAFTLHGTTPSATVPSRSLMSKKRRTYSTYCHYRLGTHTSAIDMVVWLV